jgi:hypothetical protein
MTQWTATVEEDPVTGDLIVPLPEELLKMQSWVEGDTLSWVDNKDGTWTIEKVLDEKSTHNRQ